MKIPALATILLFGFLASCSPAKATQPVNTPAVTGHPPTSTHTATTMPTSTPAPTREPTTTPTLPLAPTIPTLPRADFSGAKILAYGPLSDWRFLITLELPDPVDGPFYMMVDQNKEYTCALLAGFPNRLYCTGPMARINDTVSFVVYDQDTDEPVYEGSIFIPLVLPPSN